MESKKRRLKDGNEFDDLFPLPSETDETVESSASVEDTMRLIQKSVPKTLWQTEKIARLLKASTLEETCSNIWHFVYDHIQYKRDKDGVEQIRSPRRTWHERRSGVDCDCYTEFISSILSNLKIPHKARITKYPKPQGEIPRWQHVYPIVPRNGRLNGNSSSRNNYIVLDCVKDNFDDEQPYLEKKDYDMRLDYLDGVDHNETVDVEHEELPEYDIPESTDFSDLSSVYSDEELELGNIFKKIGKGIKKVAKKVGDTVGKGIRVINRFVNPATILLRNGFLLAMKVNMLNVAGRLRYAYLTDAQAKEKGINPDALKKIRSVKDRAETVYWQAGGKKANLKKAILKGKGNKDNKVPLSGLDGLDDVYMDMDEYNIIHADPDNMEGLGEIASGTALAAASSAVAAIAAALKQVKGIFNKGGKEEAEFQSETDNAGSAANLPANVSEDEDALIDNGPITNNTIVQNYEAKSLLPASASATSPGATLPNSASIARRDSSENKPALTSNQNPAPAQSKGFLDKTTSWVKENPGKTLLIAGTLAGGTYFLIKTLNQKKTKGEGLSGFGKVKRKRKKSKRGNGKQKIRRLNLL